MFKVFACRYGKFLHHLPTIREWFGFFWPTFAHILFFSLCRNHMRMWRQRRLEFIRRRRGSEGKRRPSCCISAENSISATNRHPKSLPKRRTADTTRLCAPNEPRLRRSEMVKDGKIRRSIIWKLDSKQNVKQDLNESDGERIKETENERCRVGECGCL